MRTGKPQNPHDLEQSLHTGGGKNKKHEGSTETPTETPGRHHEDPAPAGGKGEVRATPPSTAPSPLSLPTGLIRLMPACCLLPSMVCRLGS
eukprot:SAG25_NODE_24_length_22161_cov_23.692405_1_plen_91_part_00